MQINTPKKEVQEQPYLGYVRILVLHLWSEQHLARLFLLSVIQNNWILSKHGWVVDVLHFYLDDGRVVEIVVCPTGEISFTNPQRFLVFDPHLQSDKGCFFIIFPLIETQIVISAVDLKIVRNKTVKTKQNFTLITLKIPWLVLLSVVIL